MLALLWLGGWAAPMVSLLLRGDSEQLGVYLGFWLAVVLIPTLIVYVIGLVFGTFVTKPGGFYRFASLGWALAVVLLCLFARGPFNPFDRYAAPLAAAVALLIAVLPPMLLRSVLSTIGRIRRSEDRR